MSKNIAIVGASGAVGQEVIRLIEELDFPYKSISLLASKRSAGMTLKVKGQPIVIKETTPESFDGVDIAIFAAGGERSKALAPEAVKRGCVVIDNSSAFRQDPDVPLIVPEINPEAIKTHKGIIANPNCSTIITLLAVSPLHKAFGLKRFIASTYQAVSGSGWEAIEELKAQTRGWAVAVPSEPKVYPHPIAFNLIPHIDTPQEGGYSREELKMHDESQKILGLPDLKVSATCVRVPVFRAHSISVTAEFNDSVDLETARKALSKASGIELVDDPKTDKYPMPKDYTEKLNCGVGRLRIDTAFENGLSFWVVGDQLWKGAALNALQIAKLIK